MSEARDAGEQHPRARLYGLLNTVAFANAAAVVVVLCIFLLGAARADRALDAARVMFLVILASASGVHSVGSTDSWGGAAATFMVVVVTAAVTVLYAFGELKGLVLKVGKVVFGALTNPLHAARCVRMTDGWIGWTCIVELVYSQAMDYGSAP